MRDRCLFFNKYNNMSVFICSLILIILLFVFFFISLFVKFNFSTSYIGVVVKEDDFYVRMVADVDDLQRLQKNSLVVDKEKKDYSIISISDDFVITDSGPMKYVFLKFDIDIDEKIVNNVIKLNFIRRCTIFSKLKEMIY